MTEKLKFMTINELRKFYTPGQWENSILNIGLKKEINKLNEDGKSLLMLAVINNFSRITFDTMIKAGADLCQRSESKDSDENIVCGKNALEYAIAYNSDRALACFLKWSENTDLNELNSTPLKSEDGLYSWNEVCRIISNDLIRKSCIEIAKNGEIDKKNENGVTLLMDAISLHSPLSVETLLGLGADPSIKDNEGKTALDYAIEAKSGSTENLLRNWERIKGLCNNDSL